MTSFDAATLTADEMAAGLMAGNDGQWAQDAGTLLVVWHGFWLRDAKFRRYVVKSQFSDSLQINWEELGRALEAGLIEGGDSEIGVLNIATSIAMFYHRINFRDNLSKHSPEVMEYISRAVRHASGYGDD